MALAFQRSLVAYLSVAVLDYCGSCLTFVWFTGGRFDAASILGDGFGASVALQLPDTYLWSYEYSRVASGVTIRTTDIASFAYMVWLYDWQDIASLDMFLQFIREPDDLVGSSILAI
jgi:hypothetical protein